MLSKPKVSKFERFDTLKENRHIYYHPIVLGTWKHIFHSCFFFDILAENVSNVEPLFKDNILEYINHT